MLKKLAFCILLTAAARADVRYTKKVTFTQGEAAQQMAMRTITYLKDRRERVETLVDIGPMHVQQTELTLCDLEKKARVDNDLKICAVSPLRPQLNEVRNPMDPEKSSEPAPVKAGIGTYTMTYKVQDLGVEKVLSLDTHHYRIQMTMVSTGCAGDNTTEVDREVWMADLPRLVCPLRDATGDFTLKSDSDPAPCKIKVIQQGDVKQFTAAMRGEAVKEIMYQKGAPFMLTELTEYSSAVLDQGLFSLDGLTPVSDGEFQQQIQANMMRNFKLP